MGVLVGMLELWPSPEIGDLPALTVLATLLALVTWRCGGGGNGPGGGHPRKVATA